jgi:hypothetical protein
MLLARIMTTPRNIHALFQAKIAENTHGYCVKQFKSTVFIALPNPQTPGSAWAASSSCL